MFVWGSAVAEVSPPGEHHGHAVLVGGCNHLLVPLRSAGLYDGGHADIEKSVGTVSKRKKGVGRGDGTGKSVGVAVVPRGVAMMVTGVRHFKH